jgi:ParB/RepB/Spo0J family partition protein
MDTRSKPTRDPFLPAGNVPLRGRVKPRVDKSPMPALALDARVIPVGLIGADPDQPRKDFAGDGLDRLAASLVDRGQLQPIRVRKAEGREGFVVVVGERRWRAATIAGLGTLLCIVDARPLTADEILLIQMVENCCREDLAPLEQARAMRSLLDAKGWTRVELAAALGVNRTTVWRSLTLLELPAPVRELVVAGSLPAAVARELDRLVDKKLVCQLAGDAVAYRWSLSQAQSAARARGAPLPTEGEEADPENVARCNVDAPSSLAPIALPAPADSENVARCNVDAPSSLAPIALPAPADYLVRCNECDFIKRKSDLGGCPKRHQVGFAYHGPIGGADDSASGAGAVAAVDGVGVPPGPIPTVADAPAGEGRGVPPSAAVVKRPDPPVAKLTQAVFGWVADNGVEFTIERRPESTDKDVLDAAGQLFRKLERDYLRRN